MTGNDGTVAPSVIPAEAGIHKGISAVLIPQIRVEPIKELSHLCSLTGVICGIRMGFPRRSNILCWHNLGLCVVESIPEWERSQSHLQSSPESCIIAYVHIRIYGYFNSALAHPDNSFA